MRSAKDIMLVQGIMAGGVVLGGSLILSSKFVWLVVCILLVGCFGVSAIYVARSPRE